ncbi:hypothetical protein R0K17_21100, partial [Planococcus sp. SIMBA_143]
NIFKTFGIPKQEIYEIEIGHYIEYLFDDVKGFKHSCQLIPFPINSLVIQEKNNPLDEIISRKLMDLVLVNDFKDFYNVWMEELKDLEDYEDRRKLQLLGSEI